MLRKQILLFSKPFLTKHFGDIHKIKMSALSPTMESGTIFEWFVKEGDHVKEEQEIASIETDKAKVKLSTNTEGYIAKLLFEEGASGIPVGDIIAYLVEDKADIAKVEAELKGSSQKVVQPAHEQSTPKQTTSEAQSSQPKDKEEVSSGQDLDEQLISQLFISPRAKKLIGDHKINVSNLNQKGSGPSNRIITQDVQSFIANPPVSKQEPKITEQEPKKPEQVSVKPTTPGSSEYTEFNPTNVRKIIAKRLTESKQRIPHYYLESEVDMGPLLKFKKMLLEETQKKFSVNDFIIKACALSSQDVPEANSQWVNDKILKFHSSDVAFAVDAPSGLITPIVKQAHLKSLSQINSDVIRLTEKARKGELLPVDYMVLLLGRHFQYFQFGEHGH